MRRITVAETLQIGHDCGLTWLGEAFNQVMRHYDCFFLLSDLSNQMREYGEEFVALGLGLITDDQLVLRQMTIADAASHIGYTLTELEMPVALGDGTDEPMLPFLGDDHE